MNGFDYKKWVCSFLTNNPENLYTSYRKCQDNYIGKLSIAGERWFIQKESRYENKGLILRKRNTKNEKIVIILESPHRDEFMLNFTAPALGKTGEKIHTHLHRLLYNYNLLNCKETEIYIVNAIQFQCSLGFETSKYRDKIFKELWAQNGVKTSLMRRIMIDPFWSKFVVSHLLYGHQKCQEEGCISYRNKVLGWYPFNGTSYYFYDETDFDGKHAQCTRKSIEFQKGDKETYLKFLKDTVFPSTELSLALAIGYSAVVVARLKDEADLGTVIVNLCGTSSTGKSTAEMLMCSPFMNPSISNSGQSLSMSAQSTSNGLYQLFEGVYGIPCVIDDIATNSRFTMTDIVYALAQGAPKRRLNGNCEVRKAEGWCGVIIASSESPITDFTDG